MEVIWEKIKTEDYSKIVRDGKVNQEKYQKILFILKEPNGKQQVMLGNGQSDLAASLNDRSNDNVTLKYSTWRNINYWTEGLLSTTINEQGECSSSSFEKVKEEMIKGNVGLEKIAVINLDKIEGGRKANYAKINQFLTDNNDLILEQIEELDPDIIVTCGTFDLLKNYIIKEDVLEEGMLSFNEHQKNNSLWCGEQEEWVNIWKHKSTKTNENKDIIVIKHYHPQATTIKGLGFKEEQKYTICCEIKKEYLKYLENK